MNLHVQFWSIAYNVCGVGTWKSQSPRASPQVILQQLCWQKLNSFNIVFYFILCVILLNSLTLMGCRTMKLLITIRELPRVILLKLFCYVLNLFNSYVILWFLWGTLINSLTLMRCRAIKPHNTTRGLPQVIPQQLVWWVWLIQVTVSFLTILLFSNPFYLHLLSLVNLVYNW